METKDIDYDEVMDQLEDFARRLNGQKSMYDEAWDCAFEMIKEALRLGVFG